ncbi:hypothetical protein LTR48_002055 [Friedmanniomyces endolithicus]|uniref:Shugoshin C-terminal domain-containing protein n=1 Tax=Rachicladosporium monterosium TaxID=1507873 RepID=A0ABR0LFA1_9PEZI|nr:hypothetical protein LTR48_002055 [Friedmanniomyces endolithicus]KAK5147933.1 hypothetical protein LTR32_000683 [Rachicladosporium monterosium]
MSTSVETLPAMLNTLEAQTSEPTDVDHEELGYSDTVYNTLKAENQTLRTENDRLKRDLAGARTKLNKDARTIRGLEEQVRLLKLQRQVSQESPDVIRARHDLMQSHSGVSSMEASTVTQEQFYTPSSSRDIDLIRTDPEYSSDPATPTPPQTGATSTSYKILRYLDVDAINPMSSEGAFPDLSSAHANAHFDIEAFVELDDTEQQLALLEGSHTPPPPPHLHAPEDEAPQRQSSSSGASVRQGALKRKRISTGELAPVERPSKRQLLVTDELAQRSTSPPPPAQLMTPSDTTVERSRKRKRMSPDEPASTDHPAKRLFRSLPAVTHTGTNVDTPEPVEAERMVSPCTALLDRRLQAPIGEQGDTVTSARLLITTKSLGQRIQDPAIHGSQAVSSADSVPLGSTEQAEGDVNQRSPPLRQQSSPSQSGIASMLSGSLYGSPSVREDGEECFERGPHAVLAASNLAPYGDDASSEIEDVPFRSSEANIEEALASSAEHQETSSPDQQRTGSGTDGTYRESVEPRPEGSVEEVDHVQSVVEAEEDRRAESNEQTEHPHQAAAGREEQSQNNIEADEGAESDAEADGNALPGAAAKEGGRAMTEDDRTSQTPAPERHYTSSGSTRVSDCAMLPPQPRTAITDEASSSDNHTVPRQKATGISRSTQQGPRAAPKPRRRRKKGGSTKRTQKLAEGSTTAEERDECTSSSSSEDGIVQDPLIRRMQLTRESYWEFGFDIDLVFRHEFPDFEPCGISLAKSAKLTTLSEGMVAKLKLRADAIKDHLRRFTQEECMDQEVNLLRCLLKRKDIHPGHSDPIAVSTTIYQQRKGCRDVVNLCDFEMYSCMTVLRATNRPGYEALKQKIERRRSLRVPIKKLIPLFAVATRPAGIELLSRELNKPDFSGPCLRYLRSLLARAKLGNEPELRFPSPLERLEEWYGSGVP